MGNSDLYMEALFSMMVGAPFKPAHDVAFWQCLLPQDIEAVLWFKLKPVAYQIRDVVASQYAQQVDYISERRTLEEVWAYVRDFYMRDLDSGSLKNPENAILAFKCFLLSCNYTEALEVLIACDDLKVAAFFFGIALNEIGVIRTRGKFLD
jgi:hypothetical protein